MARKRIVKDTPKRGKLTKSQVKRIVEKVVYGEEGAGKATPSNKWKQQGTTFQVGRDARTGRFISREEAERRKATAVVETITVPKKKKIVSYK